MVLVLVFALLFLFGCQSLERDNVYDPYGSNYIGAVGGDGSSSEVAPVSSIAAPSSSSAMQSSSSIQNISSSSSTPSSSIAMPSSSSSVPSSSPSCEIQDGVSGILDYEGQEYKTIGIGCQIWMAENLNYAAEGSKCYDNKPSNCASYGRLYDWETANAVCPSGWHLPTDVEWTTLTNYVGASTAGSKLKAASGWNDYQSGNGTDNHDFSALPGGYGSSGGSFYYVGDYGYWWSSTEDDAKVAWRRFMHYTSSGVGRGYEFKSYLYSVRCLRD